MWLSTQCDFPQQVSNFPNHCTMQIVSFTHGWANQETQSLIDLKVFTGTKWTRRSYFIFLCITWTCQNRIDTYFLLIATIWISLPTLVYVICYWENSSFVAPRCRLQTKKMIWNCANWVIVLGKSHYLTETQCLH